MNNIKILIALLACFVSMASAAAQSNAATISADIGYTAIAAGESHTVALKSDGSLWAWGSNGSGQLGDGTTNRSLVPKQIGTGYTAIAATRGRTIGLPVGHTIALKSDGSLWGWGSNDHGQLGDGTTTDSLVPKQIGTGYTAIAAGIVHTIALKSDGSLWAWGSNYSGQLGDGTTTDSLVPKRIGTGYIAISAGDGHTIALKPDGSLWAWGNNYWGQLGDGTTTSSLMPKQIGTASYASISAGPGYTIALKSDGSLWVWGSNYYSRLGDGNRFNGFQPYLTNSLAPKQIDTASYIAIAAGASHTVALRSDSSLWAWGGNDSGQLGYATTAWSLVPKQIGTASYTAIANGDYHTVALKSDGSLWTWGSNYYGQLGDGTTTDSLVPKQIIDTGYTPGTPGTPDTTAPSVPTGLIVTPQITAAGANYINLFWTPSTDDVGVTVYRVYRNGVQKTGDTPYNYAGDTGLPADSFTVSACDDSGNCSAQSAAASVTSSTQAPPVPTGLTATAVNATQINLAWISSVDNIGITRYEIYRTSAETCASSPGPSLTCDTSPTYITRLLKTLSGNPPQTSYSDTGLSPSLSLSTQYSSYYSPYNLYSYFVRACDAAGNCSAASATVSTNTQSLPITLRTPPGATGTPYGPLTNQTIRITMTPPANVPNLGTGTSIFVAAVVPSSMGSGVYFKTYSNGWIPYTTCAAAPVASIWWLGPTQQLDVVPTPTDLSSVKGIKIYVGYGIGTAYPSDESGTTNAEACTDMLNNSTFTQAYTIN